MTRWTALLCLLAAGCGAGPAERRPATVTTPVARAARPAANAARAPATPRRASVQIAIGNETACLRVKGSLWCWPRNAGAKLPISTASPAIAGLGAVTDVGIGYGHVCALGAAGRVWCWGDNSHGELGAGRSEARLDTPTRVEGIEGATALAVGLFHSCALLGDGGVSCWGRNSEGQTGSDVDHTSAADDLVVPEQVDGVALATVLRSGRDQTCAETRAGWWCWGRSYLKSQLDGRGMSHNQPAALADLAEVTRLALHDETACGVFAGGSVACWGSGAFSLLMNRPLRAEGPLTIELPPARDVATGNYHACAVLQDDSVSCWGLNSNGELGRERNPNSYDPHPPSKVEGLPRVESLALGMASSCALVKNGELWCWGVPPHLAWVEGVGSGVPARVPID